MNADASWGAADAPDAPRRGVCDRRGPYHEFSRRVRVRHRLVEDAVVCSCGMEAFLCPDLRDANELFGDHVPWLPADRQPLRPPVPKTPPTRRPAPHQATLRVPRPHRGEL